MAKNDNRRKYIDAAYRILERDGLDGISIRKVADEVGCSSAALYKHFDNLDELVVYASIRFLSDYSLDVQTLSKVDLNPLQLNIQLWECFAFYAFRNVPVFEQLFYNTDPDLLSSVLYDFYQIFPEELTNVRSYMITMMGNSDIKKRGFLTMSKAVDMGMIDMESLSYLCETDSYIFRGMLAEYRDKYKEGDNAKIATRKFMKIMVKNYNSQLRPGNQILVVSPLNDPNMRKKLKKTSEKDYLDALAVVEHASYH